MRYCGVACGQFRFLLRPQGVDRALPGEGPVTGAARQRNPQHFPNVRTSPAPFYTSDPHGCAQQSLHQRSRARLAGSGSACRCLRAAAGTRDADLAWAWMTSPTTAGTGCSPHALQDRRPASQPPACCHAHRDPAGRASSIRSSCPGSVAADAGPRPAPPRRRAGAGGVGPHRRPGSAADHRPATADARALAPGGVSARDGAASGLAGSHSGGPARVCCRRGGSRDYRLRPGAAAREPRPCSAGPQIIAAGIPAVAGVPALATRFCRTESGTAPPCMRWRGRARPRRAGWPVAWSSPRAARRPPGPGTRARGRSPGSSRVPGVAPG
jgi:hypothetical protein